MNWKKLGTKLLFPPLWVMLVLTVVSMISLVFVFVKGWDTLWIAYIIYVLAFYTLSAVCIACCKTLPGYYKGAKAKLCENKYANRYLTDVEYKNHIHLYRSLIINMIYVVINGVSAIVYGTFWFALFALYYAIMATMRFLLVSYVSKNQIGVSRLKELKRSRLCAYILMTVNLALSGAVLMMVYHHRGFEYQGFLIYVMAMYTFYITTTAIIDLVKYRKYKSPVMSASKIIKLAAALVSMLSLETAMFSQFGGNMTAENQQLMIMLTGAGISIIVVTMAVYTIVRSTKEIRTIKANARKERNKESYGSPK